MALITSFDQLDPAGYYTYQDYMSWRLKERVELFLGRVFKMSPAPNVNHQKISRELMHIFTSYMKESSCQVFHAPFDVRLPVSKKEGKNDTVVQPDIVVIFDPDLLDEQGCNGTPDIVIEILSPGNSRREMKEKFELYEASLVPEYWMVDPANQDILIYSLNDQNKYIGSKPFVSGETIKSSVLKDLDMEIGKIFEK